MDEKEPLFIYEEDTPEYQEELNNVSKGAEEISSALGSNIIDMPRESTNSVQCYNIEKIKYFNHKEKVNIKDDSSIRAMEKQVNDALNRSVYDNLELDLFNALYKDKPVVTAEAKMKEPLDYINRMVRNITNSSDIEEIKKKTTMNPMQSILAQETIYTQLIEQHEEELKRQQERLDTNNQIEDTNSLIESLQNSGVNPNAMTSLQDKLNDLKNQQQQQNANAPTSPSGNGIDYDQVKDDLEDAEKLTNGFGYDTEEHEKLGEIEKKSVAGIMNVIANKRNLKRLLDILGAMRDTAISITKKNISKFGFVPTDVILGDDIPKLVQSEKLMLAQNTTKMQFYKKYGEKQLMEYETQDIQGRGPIIIGRDISGSMNGSRNNWACAISLSVLQSAKIQKRNVYIINYDTQILSETIYLKTDKNQLQQCIDVCLTKPCGGTSFTPLFERVQEIIKMSKFNKASVLVITDGDGDFKESVFNQCKTVFKEKEVDMKTIFLGNDGRAQDNLIELSSSVYEVSDNDLTDFTKSKDVSINIFDAISK